MNYRCNNRHVKHEPLDRKVTLEICRRYLGRDKLFYGLRAACCVRADDNEDEETLELSEDKNYRMSHQITLIKIEVRLGRY